jgi:hypothetical protein
MRNGRFNTSKCKGKLQKKAVMYTHPPQKAQALATCTGFQKKKK